LRFREIFDVRRGIQLVVDHSRERSHSRIVPKRSCLSWRAWQRFDCQHRARRTSVAGRRQTVAEKSRARRARAVGTRGADRISCGRPWVQLDRVSPAGIDHTLLKRPEASPFFDEIRNAPVSGALWLRIGLLNPECAFAAECCGARTSKFAPWWVSLSVQTLPSGKIQES